MSTTSIRPAIPDTANAALSRYPERLRKLLFYRGIGTTDAAEHFLNPDYDRHLHDPLLLADMEKAVERIAQALADNERTVIYSDYDADGIPGAVVLHDLFKRLGFENFSVYIPHRNAEGFGLNADAIDTFAREGVKLLITVDCGIADATHISRAKELGIDVIITDHHLPRGGTLPDAYAVVNPNRPDDAYPFKHLCGAGVAYKLAQALLAHLRAQKSDSKSQLPPVGWEKWLLDMVGIATLSDMVPLVGENRVLAHYGLTVMRKTRRIGLQQLLRTIGVFQKHLTEDDIAFMVTPRINAASRMDAPEEAFKMLATDDAAAAGALSEHLNHINEERKGVIAAMVKEIRHRLSELSALAEVIVLGNPAWRPGLLGLAANSVVETYNRPVFLWGRDTSTEPTIKGSCRSDGSVNVMDLMGEAAELFLEYGGHKHSGGFSVSHEKVHLLEAGLNGAYQKVRTGTGNDNDALPVDDVLTLDEAGWDTYRSIELLAPFGVENPKPVFLFKNVRVAGVERFGKTKNHVRLNFKNTEGNRVSAIKFFAKEEDAVSRVGEGETVNLIATMEKSTFGSTPEVRLRVIDLV